MHAIALSLSDEEIAGVARYLATQGESFTTMKSWTRREFGGLAGRCLAALRPRTARGQAKARVVVIGGGIGGATAARYLAASSPAVEVTLVEPNKLYATCFFSNLYLAGPPFVCNRSPMATRRWPEDTASASSMIQQRRSIRLGRRSVSRAARSCPTTVSSLRRALRSEFGAIAGYDEAAMQIMPHAWKAGPQTTLLRRQLESMEDGGVFVLVAPPDPFRCPPAPYERASLVASYFQRHKPRAKILILDAKDTFTGQDLFEDAWTRHYPGMIEWLPAQFTGGIEAVDVKAER